MLAQAKPTLKRESLQSLARPKDDPPEQEIAELHAR